MNLTQRDSTLQAIERYKSLQLKHVMSELYPNEVDLKQVIISDTSALDIVSTSNRVNKQLKEELTSDIYRYLPYQYVYPEIGNSNLVTDLETLNKYISDKNIPSIVPILGRLVYYQINNGFWDKSVRKIHKPSEIQTAKLFEDMELIQKHLDVYINNSQEIIKTITVEKEAFSEFFLQKKKEVQAISDNLDLSVSKTKQITDLSQDSALNNQKITDIQANQKEKLEELKDLIEKKEKAFLELENTYEELDEKLKESVNIISKQITEFQAKLDFVEDKKAYFEERNNYLNELIGREVGASLFETFKQRKGELDKPVAFWKNAVFGSSLILLVGIFFIFSNFFGALGSEELTWLTLLVRSIKTLPFIILLYYCMVQYDKERRFQEEYAFKSAVALTIKAYADTLQLGENKDVLIKEAVKDIYKTPIAVTKAKTRELNNVIKTLRNALKDAATIASTVVGKK